MFSLIKPRKLKVGDKIAAVTLSWGGPGAYPYRYLIGKDKIEKTLGLKVVEMKYTLADPDWLYENPKARAEDLMAAFEDKSIKAIISTIGGSDSVRILEYIDLGVIKKNPKTLLGYSDTTITHMACLKAGLMSYYGPSIMSSFGENVEPFAYMIDSVKRTLFSSEPIGPLKCSQEWTDQYLNWDNRKN